MDYYCPIKDTRATTLFLAWLRGPGPCNIELIAQNANNITSRYDQEKIILNSGEILTKYQTVLAVLPFAFIHYIHITHCVNILKKHP